MKYVYIDRGGERAFGAEYNSAQKFSEGLAAVCLPNFLYGFINKTGELVIEAKFTQAGNFSEGLASVKVFDLSGAIRKEIWRCIDRNGELTNEADYQWVADYSEGVAAAERGNEIFFIDRSGNELLKLNREEVYIDVAMNAMFSSGLIPAMDVARCKWGYLDRTGRFAVAPQFRNAAGFSEGLARVSILDGTTELVGFIDNAGDLVIPPKFDVDCDFVRCSSDFSESVAGIISGPPTLEGDQHFVYINGNGDIELETKYFFADAFHEGMAAVYSAETGTFGFINRNGDVEISLNYLAAGHFSEGLAAVATQ
jgi:hypothetical protein